MLSILCPHFVSGIFQRFVPNWAMEEFHGKRPDYDVWCRFFKTTTPSSWAGQSQGNSIKSLQYGPPSSSSHWQNQAESRKLLVSSFSRSVFSQTGQIWSSGTLECFLSIQGSPARQSLEQCWTLNNCSLKMNALKYAMLVQYGCYAIWKAAPFAGFYSC